MITSVSSIDWPAADAFDVALASARGQERPLVALAGRRRIDEGGLRALAPGLSVPGCAWIDADETTWLALGTLRRFAFGAHAPSSNGPRDAFALASQAQAALRGVVGTSVVRRHLRAFGALPFDAHRPASPLGDSTPGAFFLPRWTLRQGPGENEATLIVAVEAAPHDTPSGLRARLEAEWAACEAWLDGARPAAPGLPRAEREDVAAEQAAWARAAGAAIAALDGHELDKIVMARAVRLRAEAPVSPWALWQVLSNAAPGTQRFCWAPEGESAFVGASPELLFGHAGRALFVDGLAGTAPRAAEAALDAAHGEALLNSDKDRREHAFVVSAIEAALAPLCAALDVPEAPVLKRLPTVQHLHTPLRGTLAAGASSEALLRALHPTPAVGGTPRADAVERIRALETDARGLYAGPIGWVSAEDAAFAVGIRSAFVDGTAIAVMAGAGLVRGSEVASEWAETERKASPFLRLFGAEVSP